MSAATSPRRVPTPDAWTRTVAALALVLALLQLGWAGRSDDSALQAAAAGLAVGGALVAAGLLWWPSFELRMTAVVLAVGQLMIAVLTLTVGLPGREGHLGDPVALATLLTAVALLLAAETGRRARLRRRRARPGPSPYR